MADTCTCAAPPLRYGVLRDALAQVQVWLMADPDG
jgi:hypothetical protein